MELTVIPYSSQTHSTLGQLFINGQFACYTLEDEHRDFKLPGQTRIPEGRYQVVLRTEGTHHLRYKQKFPDIHHGMLHIIGVPGFKWILIHIGNDDEDTNGCLLVGDSAITNINQRGRILNSTIAYKRIYPLIADKLVSGEEVWISYHNRISNL
nr:DUF5675 family protein [uncultured Carboxylicivirga sp.]